jgi:uncharacterized protein (TIGR02145 family)
LEEIKVRWKKAALENCTGVPCAGGATFTCGTSTVADIDGNVYNTVSIGTQCWTKENLKVTKYNDNTSIPLNNTYTSGTVSTVWQGLTIGAYTIYGNEASSGANATNYGFLYNYYAAAGIITTGGTSTKNICPIGWKVHSIIEWLTMANSLAANPGTKLKENSGLWTPNNGTDNVGFSARPGGVRSPDGSFSNIGLVSFFWSADGVGSYMTVIDGFVNYTPGGPLGSTVGNPENGGSVRCLKN